MEGQVNDAIERFKLLPPKSMATTIVEMKEEAADRRVSYKDWWEALLGTPWPKDAPLAVISRKLDEVIDYCERKGLPILTTLIVRNEGRQLSPEAIDSIYKHAKDIGMPVGLVPKAFVEQQAKLAERITLEDIARTGD